VARGHLAVKERTCVKTILSWSSGKDCAYALHVLRSTPGIEVAGLMSTLNARFDRIAMHGTRRSLAEAQARAARLPLTLVEIPWPCPNEAYERAMARFVAEARAAGIEAVAFGDLFLEDIRTYREERLAGTGLKPLFPLWGRDTALLSREMVDSGLRAHLVSVDPRQCPAAFAGRTFDHAFLDDLPAGVDPCGERGEFHTFAYAGPMFEAPIACHTGETIERDGFIYTDVLA
jgi:uncharacterized protein (TIGR00290 family)